MQVASSQSYSVWNEKKDSVLQYTRQEKLVSDKHSSLMGPFVYFNPLSLYALAS